MKTLLRHFCLLILSYLFIQGAWGQAGHTLSMEQELRQIWEQTDLPAMNFGFVNGHGQRYTMAFGPAVWSEAQELTADHIFRIASLTKAITSVALLQLYEQGLIGLDDPAGVYLPEIDRIPVLTAQGLVEGLEPVTIRHLLTHTSGFGYSFMAPRLQEFIKPADWPHADLPRLEQAGKRWIYGTSTDWVGRLVEQISGISLEDYLREHVTGPLGMNHTWFNVPDSLQHYIVSYGIRDPHNDGAFRELPRIPGPVDSYNGGGGLYSSLNDYLNFLECILRGGTLNGRRILKQETVGLMFTDQLPLVLERVQEETVQSHSLAWAIQDHDNAYGRRKDSAYWSGIVNLYYSIDPQTGVAVVTMANVAPFYDPGALKLYKEFERMVRIGRKD